MEANKIAAIDCVNFAREYIRDSKIPEAIRYLNKSLRLYRTQDAQDLLDECLSNKYAQGDVKEDNEATTSNGHQRSKSPQKRPKPDEPYSKIDEQHVERVRKASTLYEVLAVEKTSNESDLKKSYRRLALLLHPDKNKAPGANEAFKAVSKAYVVLSDPQKRADYDRTGDWRTADNRRSQPSSTQMNGFNMWFEDEDDDFLAQNFFHMFFTGEIPDLDRMSRLRRRMNRERRYNRASTYSRAENNSNRNPINQTSLFVQYLPLIVIALSILLPILTFHEPLYSFHETQRYSVRRRTNLNFGVHYYVKPDFDLEGAGLLDLERRIEQEYIYELRNECAREMDAKRLARSMAQWSGPQAVSRVEKMSTPSCDEYRQLMLKVKQKA